MILTKIHTLKLGGWLGLSKQEGLWELNVIGDEFVLLVIRDRPNYRPCLGSLMSSQDHETFLSDLKLCI